MNLRSFLKSLPLIPAVAASKVKPKSFGRRVFPRKPDEFIGKIAIPAMRVIREWDEYTDRWEGMELANPRRNKYWCEPVDDSQCHKVVLCCIDWYPHFLLDDMEFYEPHK